MKRWMGLLAFCLCLFLAGEVFAGEAEILLDADLAELSEKTEDFDLPELSEEIEALTGEAEGTETEDVSQETDTLYRLLKKDAALESYGAGDLPSVYDPRQLGRVTPVRSQSANTCWAFSTLAAGEQSLLYKGYFNADSLDLSEAQLAYFFYHPVADPLGNTEGDGNHNTSSLNFLDVGSNTIFSTFALAGWVGAAEEAAAPYAGLDKDTVYADSLAYADVAHLQNAYWINFKDLDAVRVVKQMIQKYGAVAINFAWAYRYYDGRNYAYYAPLDSERANNHSAVIVGWDDTFSRENFNEAYRPSVDGAWIVKNSYGEDWGDGGYFYLSYEDSAVNPENSSTNRARAYVFDFEKADLYDSIYQYDGSAGAYNATNTDSPLTKVESKGSIANVFTIRNKQGFPEESLQAVSFALFDTAVNYQIQIYKNPTNAGQPDSGVPQLAVPVSGSTSYAGYYTVPLKEPVTFKDGETFSVVITLEKESGNPVEFFVDKSYQNGDWISFTNAVKEGESFRFVNGHWEDMAANGVTARIKAFTKAKGIATGISDAENKMYGVGDAVSIHVAKERSIENTAADEKNMTAAEPNGVSEASPTEASPRKSAATYDDSPRNAMFWGVVLILGCVFVRRSYKRRS